MKTRFECDVRLSRDGVPVVVHDATLKRTHGTERRVSSMTSEDLSEMRVPTLREVLALLRGHTRKRVILDLKVHERALIRHVDALRRVMGLDADSVVFLVQGQLAGAAAMTPSLVLRAVRYVFASHHPGVDGVACLYDGSEGNERSIVCALGAGLIVNLWSPDAGNTRRMKELFAGVCSLTVGP